MIGKNQANFIACHQQGFVTKYPDMLQNAAKSGVFLLNSNSSPEQVWQTLPEVMQQQIIDKELRFYVIDAYQVAADSGMGKRINTIMQTCFFAISGVLPAEEAIAHIKQAVEKTYGKKSPIIVKKNFVAIENSLSHLHQVKVPQQTGSKVSVKHYPVEQASDFVKQVTLELIKGHGDDLPVSCFPPDGHYPPGTTAYEKRALATEVPVWGEQLCTQCGKCPLVCPHAAIRSKVVSAEALAAQPKGFRSAAVKGKDFPKDHFMYQVAPEDCTGCGLCVDICPIRDKSNVSRKAINMTPIDTVLAQEKTNWDFFVQLPEFDRTKIKTSTIKGSMVLQPLFEFSGACVGCGETPYVKLISQLFGDRLLVANATGCSSIYGGNLPTTPWAKNKQGRGPAWSNSLFEDNAEFGLGMRLAVDQQNKQAQNLLRQLATQLDSELVEAILQAQQDTEEQIEQQRQRVAQLNRQLQKLNSPEAEQLLQVSENLCKKSVWIVGGDGWAYDIGYGGLDHVLASGKNVNILVLDTEVYSNTGGQKSKAIPTGAVAKFAASGKPIKKKDLAQLAMSYEDVYVARVAYGAKDMQTLRAFLEAESYPGVSIIIAYSPCIAHGMDMAENHKHQKLAVASGHWNLLRYDPRKLVKGENPLKLDSKKPDVPFGDFAKLETRFSMLWRSHPDLAEKYLQQAQTEAIERFNHYEQLSQISYQDHKPPG